MIKSLLTSLLFKLSHVQAPLFVNHSNPPTNHSDLCHNIWSQSARRTKNWTRHFKARPWRTMSGAATYSIDKSAMKTWKCSDSPWTLKALFPSNPRHLPRECHSMALQWLAVPGPHEPNNDKKGPIQTVQLLQLKPLIEYILFGLRFHEPLVPTVPTCGPQSLSQFRCLNIRCTFLIRNLSFAFILGPFFCCCHLPALREKSTHSQNHSKHTNTSVEWRALLHVVTNVSMMMMLMMRVQWGDLLLSRHAAPCSSDTKH